MRSTQTEYSTKSVFTVKNTPTTQYFRFFTQVEVQALKLTETPWPLRPPGWGLLGKTKPSSLIPGWSRWVMYGETNTLWHQIPELITRQTLYYLWPFCATACPRRLELLLPLDFRIVTLLFLELHALVLLFVCVWTLYNQITSYTTCKSSFPSFNLEKSEHQ